MLRTDGAVGEDLSISATVSTPPAFSNVWVIIAARAMFEAAFDFLDDLGIGLLHIRDAFHDLDLLCPRRPTRTSACRGLEVGEDQGDRLRMLVLNESQQVFAFRLL